MDKLTPVLERLAALDNPTATDILAALQPIVDNPSPAGTMSKWFQDRNGAIVHTLQIDNRTGAIWSPLSRTMDSATYRGKCLLDGSARDYAGMRVLSASERALIVSDDWHTIAYVIAK